MSNAEIYRFIQTVSMNERERLVALAAMKRVEFLAELFSEAARGIGKLRRQLSLKPRFARAIHMTLSPSM